MSPDMLVPIVVLPVLSVVAWTQVYRWRRAERALRASAARRRQVRLVAALGASQRLRPRGDWVEPQRLAG